MPLLPTQIALTLPTISSFTYHAPAQQESPSRLSPTRGYHLHQLFPTLLVIARLVVAVARFREAAERRCFPAIDNV